MKYAFLFFIICIYGQHCFADRPMTLATCEELFLKNNLLLLAEQYNITASKAAVIQARIWEQPYLSAELNAYNPDRNKLFDVGAQGQKSAAIQQLVYLGGKKKSEIAFAKSNAELSELQFEQLLGTIKYQLYQSFYTLYFDQQKISSLTLELNSIDSLAIAYKAQAEKNNVSLKDVVRLQALALSFRSDMLDIQKGINEEQKNIQLITGVSQTVEPEIEPARFEKIFTRIIMQTPEELVQTGLQKNPDYLYAQKVAMSNGLMLKWQQALSVPDITVGASYDQSGGAFNHQVNLTLGVPLPLWNKNKGNIRMAKAQLDQSKIMTDYKAQELKTEIATAYANWKQQGALISQMQDSYNDNLKAVYDGVLTNFHKRNISLLEFTDFMESYNQSVSSLNEIRKQLAITCATLNYLVNDNIF